MWKRLVSVALPVRTTAQLRMIRRVEFFAIVISYVILRSEILPKKFSTCYIILCGFLFGFPIGCKLTADFYSSNYISREKASALCCFTNNLSPVFVITAIQEILQLPLSPVYIFLIYGIPFLYGMSMLLLYHRTPSSTQKETANW